MANTCIWFTVIGDYLEMEIRARNWQLYNGQWCHAAVSCYTNGHKLYRRHDDVIKWKHFPRNWPFVRGIDQSPVNFSHKGRWRGALMFSLICALINGWVNSGEAGDLRRYCVHYDIIVMAVENYFSGPPPGIIRIITMQPEQNGKNDRHQPLSCFFKSLSRNPQKQMNPAKASNI